MQQEGHVVARDVQIALVNVGYVGQGIEILNLRPVGSMHALTMFQIRNAQNFLERLALCILHDRVVEFLASHEIDGWAVAQRLLWQYGYVRPNEANLYARIGVLDRSCQPDVSGETRSTVKQHQECVLLGDLNRFLTGNVVGWRV